MKSDIRFDLLHEAIKIKDKKHIIGLGNELYQDYWEYYNEFTELNKIFLDLLFDGESHIIGKLEYKREFDTKKIGYELFVEYAEIKMIEFINHVTEIKNFDRNEADELREIISMDVLDLSYSLIDSFYYEAKRRNGNKLEKVYSEIYSKVTFDSLIEKIFGIPYKIIDLIRNFTPNVKYTQSMFEYTDKLIVDGYKKMAAYQKTLEYFNMNPLDDDSYRRSYYRYLKNK